ncbi:type IV secretory system conjugative DNA transfer family protein (plasmid) [Alkalihalophilus sp. As8PL]|uniref:Type IV secretory system conjugative DNA transfer family protein n=1 Tax=Alkalihalophilus sp. As8PL TaxID=3237103 RepID=A0AB39BNL6_9BACI
MIRWYETKTFNKIARVLVSIIAITGLLLFIMLYVNQFTRDTNVWTSLFEFLTIGYHPFVFTGYFAILLPFTLWTWAMATRFPVEQSDLEKFPQKQIQWLSKKLSTNSNPREYLKNAEFNFRMRLFITMLIAILSNYLFMVTMALHRGVLPYLGERVDRISIDNPIVYESLFANIQYTINFIFILPLILTFMISLVLFSIANTHWKEVVELFKTWEYKKGWQKDNIFEGKYETMLHPPDVDLGPDSDSKEMVRLKGKDRTLNSAIIGSIGTGKTAALVLPMVNQDLHHMTKMINNYKEYYSRKDYHSEDVKGQLLNGISIIEPSNDLCQKVYQLVKAHGIPEEVVFYLDPTNPDTPSINLFNAPVDKVAEMFTMVIEGIGENVEFFFAQSQRVHLKHYIYLLMLHDDEIDPMFDDLINMYNETQLVANMHQKLKRKIKKINRDSLETRDQKNEYSIIKGIDEWFDQTLEIMTSGRGDNERTITNKDKNSPYYGEPLVIDKKEEHVVGLRNILNDISANIEIRRVLFGKSDFDFDKHLEYGGILLVNTSKGSLSNLSDVFGKFILLSLQNAVFRRKPNISPYHHILVDEFPDYQYESFASFPAQSRKYKAIVTVVGQTLAQLSRKYREDYMHTLLSTLRNKFVYGDVSPKDAEIFSAIFGTEEVYTESETEQTVSALQDDPSRRMGYSYAKEERPIMSPSDIIYQKEFQCAVKLVEDNKPITVRQIEANFVPKEEFINSKYIVDDEAADYWYKIRQSNLEDTFIKVEEGISEDEIKQAELEDKENDKQETEKEDDFVIKEHRYFDNSTPTTIPFKENDTHNDENVVVFPITDDHILDQSMFEEETSNVQEVPRDFTEVEGTIPKALTDEDEDEDEDQSPSKPEDPNEESQDEGDQRTDNEDALDFSFAVGDYGSSSVNQQVEGGYEEDQEEALKRRREQLKKETDYEEEQRQGRQRKQTQYARISKPTAKGESLLKEARSLHHNE